MLRCSVGNRADTDKGERRGSERELEQPPTQRRDIVVVALRRGLGDDVDLFHDRLADRCYFYSTVGTSGA